MIDAEFDGSLAPMHPISRRCFCGPRSPIDEWARCGPRRSPTIWGTWTPNLSPLSASLISAILSGLSDPGPTHLRLLTLNCLWRDEARARLAVLGGLLEPSDFDVVCLQEVVFRSRVALLRSLAPSYAHAVHRPLWFGVLGGLVTLSR